MMHDIFLVEEVSYCGSLMAGTHLRFGPSCWWEWNEPDCSEYVPEETERNGVPILCSPCKQIRYRTRVISKQYKRFEYDELEGITIGNALHPINNITTLIIDGQYYVGRPEVESGE